MALLKEAVRDVDGVTDYHVAAAGIRGAHAARCQLHRRTYLASNPELLALTQSEHGQNLTRGLKHMVEDLRRTLKGMAPAGTEEFEVGKSVAVTPGKVVLAQRADRAHPVRADDQAGHAEPILIVPAWIMKYYILDLSPRNSMVKYLVDQGHTVFMMSWKNPDEKDRDIGMDDYVDKGFRAALDAVTAIVPNTQDPRRGLLHRRHPAGDRRGGAGARPGRAAGFDHDVRRADRFHRARRTGVLHQSEPAGDARSDDAQQGRARKPADGRRLRIAARAGSALAADDQQRTSRASAIR